MPNLYTIVARKEPQDQNLSKEEIISIVYHDIFDYPLTLPELIKWKAGSDATLNIDDTFVNVRNGYFFREGKEGLIYKRLLRKRASEKKLEIAKKAARVISILPSVKMVGITGSLAMENSSDDGDIDLMIITKGGLLWTTRPLVYLLLKVFGIKARKAGVKKEKDRLCLNMWLDESSLNWPKSDRNIYTAHEITQIRALVNKDDTYEKLLSKNKWVLGFWPNSVKVIDAGAVKVGSTKNIIERFFFWIQYKYMKGRITKEIVTPKKALFHPNNWGEIVLSRMAS